MSEHEQFNKVEPTPGERFSKFLKRKDVSSTVAWAFFYTLVFVLVALYLYPRWMPKGLSNEMRSTTRLMVIFTIISAPVCGFVLSMATHAFLRRHKGDTPPADGPGFSTNRLGVATFSVMASILTLTAVIYGLVEMNTAAEASVREAKDAMVVKVVGNQWVWTFEYPESMGGFKSEVLNLPLNKAVVFDIVSADVNHSFWPVQLGVKVDANRLAHTTVTTKPIKLGEIDVKCAELCGLYHAYMETTGAVMTTDDFNKWVITQGGHTA